MCIFLCVDSTSDVEVHECFFADERIFCQSGAAKEMSLRRCAWMFEHAWSAHLSRFGMFSVFRAKHAWAEMPDRAKSNSWGNVPNIVMYTMGWGFDTW